MCFWLTFLHWLPLCGSGKCVSWKHTLCKSSPKTMMSSFVLQWIFSSQKFVLRSLPTVLDLNWPFTVLFLLYTHWIMYLICTEAVYYIQCVCVCVWGAGWGWIVGLLLCICSCRQPHVYFDLQLLLLQCSSCVYIRNNKNDKICSLNDNFIPSLKKSLTSSPMGGIVTTLKYRSKHLAL